MFKYSERKGTVASKKFPDDVSEAKKTERIMRLNDLQKEITYQKNLADVGQVLVVMVDSTADQRTLPEFAGRTDGGKLVIVSVFPEGKTANDYRLGDMVPIKITEASPHCLRGIPLV